MLKMANDDLKDIRLFYHSATLQNIQRSNLLDKKVDITVVV